MKILRSTEPATVPVELVVVFHWDADTQADLAGRVRNLHAAAVDVRDRPWAYRRSP